MSIAEGLVVNGVTEILKKLVPVVAGQIGLAWGVKDDLKKLGKTLEMILAVIADAEKKQNNDAAVALWLRRLKDVAYDADDVMDEFSYETMRRSARGNKLKNKFRDFASSSNNPLVFRSKMAREIKKINQKLDAITKDIDRFQLQIIPSCNTNVPHVESSEQRSRKTDSSIIESQIKGRENDKRRIIDMLTKVTASSSSSASSSNSEKVSVISIVGMGGLGKTTLAQLVYNDDSVKEQFELCMWVHVSDYFDVEKLFIKIMESATKDKFDSLSNFDVLASKVRQQLDGKKYLLVLDDIWNENDEQWERLCRPLLTGAEGSKILITTRKFQVANVVKGHILPYKLEGLQDDEIWSIIQQKAFSPGGALETASMTSIGQKIAKSCRGLPLAARSLGSLMRTRNKEGDWLSIQDNINYIWKNTPESQDGVIGILKLSYDNLSSQLKQCFSYCSIFPKGTEIDRETLVQLWIAEGFLDNCNVGGRSSVEDIGDEYFMSLVWSSFLESVRESEPSVMQSAKIQLGDIMKCKMHDLVHDLARDVAGDQELLSLKVSEFKNTSEIRRLHLTLDENLSSTFLEGLTEAKKLRTLFIPEGSDLKPSIFFGNRHLHILHVGYPHRWKAGKFLSLSLKLRHLRYLYLEYAQVVSDLISISKLYNLETLVLRSMKGGIENLLRNIGSLKKLRHLSIPGNRMEELPDSVTSLSNLQTLDLSRCHLKSLPESITDLKKLRFLDISYNDIEELPGFIVNLGNLQTLDVSSCTELKFLPESVKGLEKLKIFDFRFCRSLEKLPEDLGALTQLRGLSIDGTGITVLPESCTNLINLEFVGLRHSNLIFLEFVLPKWVNNWTKVRRFDFPTKELPVGVGKLVFLEKLIYRVKEKVSNGNGVGVEELENLNSLEDLNLHNLENVKDPIDAEKANLKGKQNLRQLRLVWGGTKNLSDMMMWDKNSCNFQVFEALQPHAGLKMLVIFNFMGRDLPKWMCVPTGLPSGIVQLQHLTFLLLDGLKSLKSLDIGGFPSLDILRLRDMFSLEDICCSHPCPSLRHLFIKHCRKLTEISSFPSLEFLNLKYIDHQLVSSVGKTQTSLKGLGLKYVNKLVYFPLSILQRNCNLRTLSIKRCDNLQGFRVNENQENKNEVTRISVEFHSESIRGLFLEDCPVLKSLPDIRGCTSLRHLTIRECPKVKESLTYNLKSLSFLEELKIDFIERDIIDFGDILRSLFAEG